MTNILSWNIDGLSTHKNELDILTREYNPLAICLQETKFRHDYIPHYKNFNCYYLNEPTHTAQGGIMIMVSKQFNSQPITLNSKIKTIAVRISHESDFVLCNIYWHGNERWNLNDFTKLTKQLGNKYIITGDFNAHNQFWGSQTTDSRGEIIESLIDNRNLNLLNNGDPTFFSYSHKTFSHIDLTLATPNIAQILDWYVDNDLHHSDHFPIIIKLSTNLKIIREKRQTFNMENANWKRYIEELELTTPLINYDNKNINECEISIRETIIKSAKKSIPKNPVVSKSHNYPWYDKKLELMIIKRKQLQRKYFRTKNLNDFGNWMKQKYLTKKYSLEHKQKNIHSFISSIDYNTSTKEIYNKIKLLNGKFIDSQVYFLKINNKITYDKLEISKHFADSFAHNSKTTNYSKKFLKHKKSTESKIIDQSLFANDVTDLNKPFSLNELNNALKKLKGSTPGNDLITYEMIRKSPDSFKIKLLEFLNKIWSSNEFPDNWRKSIIKPILKEGKDPKISDHYRPIAFTNCNCKILEKMANERLIWFLERNSLLDKRQSGFRKKRCCLDNLIFFENEIKKTFVNNNYMIAISFDIKKAYDMTWRRHIIDNLIEFGIKGNMLRFIQNLISNRKASVNIGNTFSDYFDLENGIVQGSVISVSLFLVAINSIFKCFNNSNVHVRMFADDLIIFISSKNFSQLQTELNDILRKLEKWSTMSGFLFSPEKTQLTLFTRKYKIPPKPIFKLYGKILPYKNSIKFLGMTFDSKLNWKEHIENIRANALKSLNIIKILSNHKFGVNREILLNIYKSIVQSKLSYGDFIFNSANDQVLKRLDSIHNQGIRIAIGAFRTSPISSILINSGLLPLNYYRFKSGLNYILNKHNQIKNPISELCKDNLTVFRNQKENYQSSMFKILKLKSEFNISFQNLEKFSFPKYPPWSIFNFEINTNISHMSKNNTPTHILKSLTLSEMSKYEDHIKIYTDASRINERCGYSIVSNDFNKFERLPDFLGIYHAELHAILEAIKFGEENYSNKKIIICSDSLSSIQSLHQTFNFKEKINTIFQILHESNNFYTFLWIPSHIGIFHNEEADRLAKLSLNQQNINEINLPTEYFKNLIRKKLFEKWNQEWLRSKGKMRELKNDTTPFKNIKKLNRRDSIVLTRCRIGHSKITHKHLIDKSNIPLCTCSQILTIKHIFDNCKNFTLARKKFDITNSKILASDSIENQSKILKFLKFIKIYNLI